MNRISLTGLSLLVYDIEIVNGIPPRGGEPLPDINYCKGWDDHHGMGISVIGVYDYKEDRYRVFCKDNFYEFQKLVDSRLMVAGFNSLHFDNRVCQAHSIDVPRTSSYDLLVEVWRAAGLPLEFTREKNAGYGLDATAAANLEGQRKTGHGAMAPVQWQRGERGSVVDYCLADVWITKRLIDKVIYTGQLIDPKTGETLNIQKPPVAA